MIKLLTEQSHGRKMEILDKNMNAYVVMPIRDTA